MNDVRCLDCGLPYSEFGLDNHVPRSQWLEIHPEENGVLCANCVVKRASRIPGCTLVHMIFEVQSQSLTSMLAKANQNHIRSGKRK